MRKSGEDGRGKAIDRKRINLAALLEDVDHSQLVVALVATNPELEDILPDDPQLKRDVARVREKIAERQMQSGWQSDSTGGVQNVVAQNVHIHLWDQRTSERVQELGASVVDLFKNVKDRLIEAKEKYIDGDNRDVISFEEAISGFKSGLGGMVDFMTRRDRAPEAAQDDDLPTATPWGASKELVETLPASNKEAVVRLASSAVGDVLNKELKPAPEPTLDAAAPAPYRFGSRDRSEPEATMEDYPDDGPPQAEDDNLYTVRSSTHSSPHYLTGNEGKPTTYDKTEAATYGESEAGRVADDWSSYAASKGYGYTYQIEAAEMDQAQQLQAGASLSM